MSEHDDIGDPDDLSDHSASHGGSHGNESFVGHSGDLGEFHFYVQFLYKFHFYCTNEDC